MSLQGCYFEITLCTRKSAQTGITHTWKLYANDIDISICPIRVLLRLAQLYGPNCTCTGPLFLKVNNAGGVLYDQPVVLLFGLDSLSPAHLHQDRSSCQSCSYKGHADFGIPWVGTLWDTLFPSWRLPVLSEAQGMDCWDACSMGWLVPGGSNHHVSLLLLPK